MLWLDSPNRVDPKNWGVGDTIGFTIEGKSREIHIFFNEIYVCTMPIHPETDSLTGIVQLWGEEDRVELLPRHRNSALPVREDLHIVTWDPSVLEPRHFLYS